MKRYWPLFLLLNVTTLWAQTKIIGRVVDADSQAVASATVRLWGLTSQAANAQGYFQIVISQQTAKSHALAPGRDLYIEVEKEGMVVLEPPDKKFRLPDNPATQAHFRIVMVKKGSPLLARSERMLNYLIRERIKAGQEALRDEFSRRDILAEAAERFGLEKSLLVTAITEHKARLRDSRDDIKAGLADQDDFYETQDFKVKAAKNTSAKSHFRKAIVQEEKANREARARLQKVQENLPEAYFGYGSTFFNEARYDSAAFFFAKADTNNADKLNMWGQALYYLAAYDKAMQKFRMAYIIDSTKYGPNHPDLAIFTINIGEVLYSKGDHAGALAKFDEALAIFEKLYGRYHPNVAIGLSNIAAILHSQGDSAGAVAKFEEALTIFEKFYGRNHPNVAIVLSNIAVILKSQGECTAALAKCEEALAIFEKSYGRNHPDVATTLNTFGEVLRIKGNYDGALAKYNEALLINKKYFDQNHPNVGALLNNIALALESKGDYVGALAKYDEALTVFEKSIGIDHPNTQTVRENRNRAYIAYLSLQQQLKYNIQRWFALLQAPPQPLSASDSLNLLNGLGVGYTKQSKADSALLFLRQALPIAERLKEQEMLGTLYNNLGSANKLKKDWPQARQWLEKSLNHNRALAGDSAAVLAYTYFHLAGVAQAEGQTALSREYAQKSLALAERHKLAELRVETEAMLKQKR